jgi:agmatinase
MNFGGIYPPPTFRDSKFVIVPVPYDLTSTYQPGSRLGPSAILEASANMELYDEELGKEIYLEGIHTLPPVDIDARGPKYMIHAVRKKISKIAAVGKIPVILGGEHSITLGAVQAVMQRFPKLSVLQLDAHADMRDRYQKSPYSHACVARRITEICPLVQVGVRSMSSEEAAFITQQRIKSYSAEFITKNSDGYEKISKNLKGDVFVTIDLDVLDPSLMPATGTPEPGGLFWNDVLSLLKKVAQSCTIRGFDIVELAPLPGIVAPDFLAAKLIYRLMGYITK